MPIKNIDINLFISQLSQLTRDVSNLFAKIESLELKTTSLETSDRTNSTLSACNSEMVENLKERNDLLLKYCDECVDDMQILIDAKYLSVEKWVDAKISETVVKQEMALQHKINEIEAKLRKLDKDISTCILKQNKVEYVWKWIVGATVGAVTTLISWAVKGYGCSQGWW